MKISNGNVEQITSEENNQNKTYINCYCFQISDGIIYIYIYIITSILINIINHKIYFNYQFNFNYFLLFLQQILLLFLFSFYYKKNIKFKETIGDISLNDFLSHKFYYIIFSCFFLFTIISPLQSNQKLINITTFLTPGKILLLLMIFFIDFFYYKKQFTKITLFCIFMIISGSFLIFSRDGTYDFYKIFWACLGNIATVIYIKLIELFRIKTGFTNLKLLIYNSILIIPVIIVAIFISDEYKKIYEYYNISFANNNMGLYLYIFFNCALGIILNSSFFLSNEKNSAIITQLLSNSKDIFASGILFIFQKNDFGFNKIFGLMISNIGAIVMNFKSLIDNLKFGLYEEKRYYIQLPELNEDVSEPNKL